MGIFSFTPLDKKITFLRPVPDDSFDGAGSETYVPVATVRANIKDVTVANAERLAEVVNIAARPATLLMRFRDDITADMLVRYGSRTLEIVGNVIELGRREALQMRVQDYSTQGVNP